MDNKRVAGIIADIHNKIATIFVRGDDVFKMADALQACRVLTSELINGDDDTGTTGRELPEDDPVE